jgi:hypothetical protein
MRIVQQVVTLAKIKVCIFWTVINCVFKVLPQFYDRKKTNEMVIVRLAIKNDAWKHTTET